MNKIDKKNDKEAINKKESTTKNNKTPANASDVKQPSTNASQVQNIGNKESEKEKSNTKNIKFLLINGRKLKVEEKILKKDKPIDFSYGDTVRVYNRIKEGDKQRIQVYEGIVTRKRGEGQNQTFTVRRLSQDISVERIFFLYSPYIEKIEVKSQAIVHRANLSYLRKGGHKLKEKKKR